MVTVTSTETTTREKIPIAMTSSISVNPDSRLPSDPETPPPPLMRNLLRNEKRLMTPG